MGNCTSKKSAKSLKIRAAVKTNFHLKMEKEQEIHSKRSTKKIVPFTKGEITSFGFKKKASSPSCQLPVAVMLASNGRGHLRFGDEEAEDERNFRKSSQKNLSDGYHSGSSIESLSHAPIRSTPKMIRKKDLIGGHQQQQQQKQQQQQQQAISNIPNENELNSINGNVRKNGGDFQNAGNDNRNGISSGKLQSEPPSANRFGFRKSAPPRLKESASKSVRTVFSPIGGKNGQSDSLPNNKKSSEGSARSRSEGPNEIFVKQTLRGSNSVQFGLNRSKSTLANVVQPTKFTLQTSHLPKPQFPVRLKDSKTAKTAANYYRREGIGNELDSSKEVWSNEDSGFGSHGSANNTLEKKMEIFDSSPGFEVRRRLPAFKGKKLEMKIVGNKFELLKKDDEGKEGEEEKENCFSESTVTEVSVIRLPVSGSRTGGTAVINTGLVEERTNQYLKRISQPYSNRRKKFDSEFADAINKMAPRSGADITCQNSSHEEKASKWQTEEKSFRDSRRSEKYFMSEGCDDGLDELLPGEAMADLNENLSFNIEESLHSVSEKNGCQKVRISRFPEPEVNTIRLDALKLSRQFKCKNLPSSGSENKDENSFGLFLASDRDEETLTEGSILEQLSSDSDSRGDKGENRNNDKEKDLKLAGNEELETDDNTSSKAETDAADSDVAADEPEVGEEGQINCLMGSISPDSPETPTHTINSLSISEGRDFLIDDEIADQPQLCFSEKYVEVSRREEILGKKLNSGEEFADLSEARNAKGFEEIVPKKSGEKNELGADIALTNVVRYENGGISNLEDGTLSPCESIASDDLMLDFETNSLEETAARLDNAKKNVSTENDVTVMAATASDEGEEETFANASSQKYNSGLGCGKLLKTGEGNNGCNNNNNNNNSNISGSTNSETVSSPIRRFKSNEIEDDSVKLDRISYQHMFQDVVSMKAMLLKLRNLLSESEGSLQENGRIRSDCGSATDGIAEDELADLRRQVLFLQQQLEEREKTVQFLKLKINMATERGVLQANGNESRKQCNATTQTGLDQFHQDFPHFRIFQTITPVI